MSTGNHQIQLNAELERRLRERAAATGTDAETFILRALEEKLQAPLTFTEIFEPLQQAFSDWPESAEDLNQTFEDLRSDIHRARRAKAP